MKIVRTDSGVAVDRPGSPPLPLRHIIGVGRNYPAHADEQGLPRPERPMLFAKNLSTLAVSGEDIVIPRACQDKEQVDFEGELAVVIGAPARDVARERAMDFVLGFCVANDVSARWWQKQGAGGQFYRGKSFDTFCPLGPALTPADSVADVQGLRIRTTLSGEVMQDASTAEMLFPVDELIAEITRGTTLVAGTVILTGTPGGVGMARTPARFLREGDVVTVEIEGLGSITNRVRMER